MVGETFGNYEVVATLGKGGMGVVFLAEHQRIARRAAIKVLAPELTTDPDVVKRFFIEARATSLIRHPGIVEVFDCDVDGSGRAYIVMEYLEGETLAACLRRVRSLPWPMACAVARRIAGAVAVAHARGIIHRDLKPENVFLIGPGAGAGGSTPGNPIDGEVERDASARPIKILDFGIAKLLSNEMPNESITRTGMVLGTPKYISPEQCSAAASVDHRADIYSLGCILFEMICGRPPFESEGFRALLAAHVFQDPPRVSSVAPAVPAWLDDLIGHMLAKRATDRPTSMADVAESLAAANINENEIAPSPATAAGAESPRVIHPAPRDAPAPTLAAGSRRRGITVASVVAGGLAALAAAGGLALSRTASSGDRAPESTRHTARRATGATTTTATTTTTAATATAAAAAAAAASPDRGLESRPEEDHLTSEPTSVAVVNVGVGLASRSEPDARRADRVVPTPARAPSPRRAVEIPARLHSQPSRTRATIQSDGIVDL